MGYTKISDLHATLHVILLNSVEIPQYMNLALLE